MWITKDLMKKNTEGMFMDEARVIAAQCWCDKRTEHLEMIPDLAEVFAEQLSYWIYYASQNQINTEYYRNLLIKCGEILGDESYISDDGSIQDEVLCAKIPEIIERREKIRRKSNPLSDNIIKFLKDFDYDKKLEYTFYS